MHQLVGTHDRVNGTGLDTQRAPYTVWFVDEGYGQWQVFATLGIERQCGEIQQCGKRLDARLAARRAAVYGRTVDRNSLRIRPASVIAAFGALGLRQYRINAIDKR